MSVLEFANKLLEILALNELPPKLRWSENGDLKFSDRKEGEEDNKKPRSTETTSPCPTRNSFYTVECTHVA